MTSPRLFPCPVRITVGLLTRITIVAAIFVWTAGPISGQELLNPGFDTDLSEWTIRINNHSWSPEDCLGSPSSGSILAFKDYAGSALLTTRQCFDATEGQKLGLDVKYLVPATSEDAEIWISIAYYSQPDCVDLMDFSQTGPFVIKGSWATARVPPFQAPPGAVASQVYIGVIEAVDDVIPVAVHFDNAVIEIAFFADGFESGDTMAWSGSVQ